MISVGAEHIMAPLGAGAEEVFEKIRQGHTGIRPYNGSPFPAAVFSQSYKEKLRSDNGSFLVNLGRKTALGSLAGVSKASLEDKWLFVLSTTKGDIEWLEENDPGNAKLHFLAADILSGLPIGAETMVVSNACISGLLAVITAHDLLVAGHYDHALILGADLVTRFTSSGFESFFALSEEPSKPFDRDRSGLSLGEAAASVVLSNDVETFRQSPLRFAGGASANDANHISGPSRTGEGLVRAVRKAFRITGFSESDIDFISAHGTGTRYNDDMESIAFNRCGLQDVPVNSFKGFFGHTLGAAGLVELVMSMQSVRNNVLIRTMGCDHPGTVEQINVLIANQEARVNAVLKTASGFGGCNAAGILLKP